MSITSVEGLLLRFPAGARPGRAAGLSAGGRALKLEELFSTPDGGRGAGVAGSGSTWYRAELPTAALAGANAWDAAYDAMRSGLGLAGGPDFVEPDFVQEWPDPRRKPDGSPLAAAGGEVCVFDDQDPKLPRGAEFAWHLGVSQLREARQFARQEAPGVIVRIAHLDTGYDPKHVTFPKGRIEEKLQQNFTDQGDSDDARDPGIDGLMKNPGHGPGTLGILAGGKFKFKLEPYDFNEELGGAPDARIVPIRVANSVVQMKTSAVAKAFNYAAELCGKEATRVHVLSMSMGGVASAAWADAVNLAYEAGIVLVTAAGNNFSVGPFALPARSVVYPARFRRVIAACGIMANGTPYFGLARGTMQGNWGPASKMRTAVAAYTPNTPWAQLGCPEIVDMNGAGTSSATPQVAAAAALYVQTHSAALDAYPEPWMRVEAVRRALFESADGSGDSTKLGRGGLRARDALRIVPPTSFAGSDKTVEASATLAFFRVLTGVGAAPPSSQEQMFALEATQLLHRWSARDKENPLESVLPDPDAAASRGEALRFLEKIESHPDASRALKAWAKTRLGDRPAASAVPKAMDERGCTTPDPAGPAEYGTPAYRSLRGYAIDPSLTTTLDTVAVSEVEFRVPWEELDAGPVGEYLEVMDIDPPSGCVYAPVDLDDPRLLAQDGLSPSEGTPQFHQQMVYAVSSLTIQNFERALGRWALWRPQPDPKDEYDDSRYVPRLRVYPHALREANAYYSPQKLALLFGYFNAGADDPGAHMPGGRVFTCLSHDIIAHETTHALLDGMHRHFMVASNPDVRAFHEAFADIVALFQHFTFPEILRHAIAGTRGQLRTRESILGSLAVQFGRTTGKRGGLREAIGTMVDGRWVPHKAVPGEYERAASPHERGSYLVAAVFDAFLSIYEHRVADLVRLASGGTGELAPGAIHPDLVGRLADEAAKSARHVLAMCIRALDYCPPTDLTFGEYLRAIITADRDLVPDDDRNYRVAFVEAFRKRGIYPRDVPTLSVESLLWSGPEAMTPGPSARLRRGLTALRGFATRFIYAPGRKEVFEQQRNLRRMVHNWLRRHFKQDDAGKQDAAFLGLDPALPFEVHSARIAMRNAPDGNVLPQLLVGLLQRDRDVPIDPTGRDARGTTTFEGGSTIVADLSQLEFSYCVRKNMRSRMRRERQLRFELEEWTGLRATYGGRADEHGDEPFAMLHRGV